MRLLNYLIHFTNLISIYRAPMVSKPLCHILRSYVSLNIQQLFWDVTVVVGTQRTVFSNLYAHIANIQSTFEETLMAEPHLTQVDSTAQYLWKPHWQRFHQGW